MQLLRMYLFVVGLLCIRIILRVCVRWGLCDFWVCLVSTAIRVWIRIMIAASWHSFVLYSVLGAFPCD